MENSENQVSVLLCLADRQTRRETSLKSLFDRDFDRHCVAVPKDANPWPGNIPEEIYET
jgi:hypothetical protein